MLIANELIDSRKRSIIKGVLFKIDLEKAFDHVNWGFVDYLLNIFGFRVKWRGRICERIYTIFFSVLVNGSPSRLFNASRGIHQDDPLPRFYS